MAHISIEDALAWTEPSKQGPSFTEIDEDLDRQVADIVISRLSARFDTIAWVGEDVTPELVKTLIAMYYVSFVYDKMYSTDDSRSSYGELLRATADRNIQGLIDGNIDLPGEGDETYGFPVGYPNDISSAMRPTPEDPSLGPAKFSMGTVW